MTSVTKKILLKYSQTFLPININGKQIPEGVQEVCSQSHPNKVLKYLGCNSQWNLALQKQH